MSKLWSNCDTNNALKFQNVLYANNCGDGDVSATDVWVLYLRFNLGRKIPRLRILYIMDEYVVQLKNKRPT